MKYSEFIERKRHGSLDFPLQYYYVDKTHPQYIMPAHWHKEFEIIRVLKGQFKVFLNNIEYNLKSGDILLIESGYVHRGEPASCIYECVVFDLNMLIKKQSDTVQKFISPFLSSSVQLSQILYNSKDKIHSLVNTLFDTAKNKEPYYELEIYSLIYKFFAMIYTENKIISSSKAPHSLQAETITRLIDWIEKNFTDSITLKTLSDVSGLTPKYLCRIFKEYTSKTIIGYINELRIENACYEISQKGKSITEAALNSGFNDLSYFCKTFKKYKNITPNEFKKKQAD